MTRAATSNRARWAHGLLLSALLGALAFACNPTQLAPRPGRVETTELARVPVPGGHVNAAGGNYFHERVDLSLDTRLGPFAIGAVYNSAGGWLANVDASYAGGTLRDASGAVLPLASLADGAPVPGTHWTKLDATRVATRGGLVHAFDAGTGRLLAIHWASAPYPRLRFPQQQIGAQWRTSAVEQCASESACARLFTLTYDASARLVRVDDLAGRSALYGYDGAGRLVSARGGLDVATGRPGERYAYAGSFLAAITSSEGERIEIASDAQGRALEVRGVGAGDPTWRFHYAAADAAGVFATTATDPLGHATHLAIDGSARVLSTTNPLGERTTFTWDGVRPTSRTLPDGARTSWTWTLDALASETTAGGNTVSYAYQAGGVDRERPLRPALREARDGLGLLERRSYDASGRLTGITNGAGETTSYAYGTDEALLRVTAPDGTILEHARTGDHGRPLFAAYVGAAESAVFVYDRVGNLLRSTAPDPQSGGVKQRLWDADRNLAAIEVIDAPASGAPQVQTIAIAHRSDGQPLRVDRPYGGATTFSYDALGRLVAIAEQASPGAAAQPGALSVTTFERDALGRVTAMERANGMREEIAYDAAGRPVRRRALRSGVLESEVQLEWLAGRLVRAVSSAGDFEEALAYDAAGRLSEVRHTLGETTRFAYDLRGRVARVELALAGGAPLASLSHAYDLADRERAIGYLGAALVSRDVVAGRLERSTYGNGVREDHFRNVQSGRASGSELWRGGRRIAKSDVTRAGDPGGALLDLRSEVSDGTDADGVTREEFRYAVLGTQNAMERRVASSIALPSGAPGERIQYDALSNFVAATSPYLAQSAVYNAERNRVLSAQEPPSGSPYVPAVVSRFAHDPAGFATTRTFELGSYTFGLHSFAWNARGQIAAIYADGALAATFEYDPLGRRSARTAGGVTTRWRFGGLVEADAGGAPIAIDLGELRIDLAGAQHRYRHADERGNPKLVTNAAGRVVRHNAYSAYGQIGALGPLARDVGFARGIPIATPYAEYLLIGARLYVPRLARFLSPDPVWNPINAYAYTLGNPIDFWDASGLHAGSHHDDVQALLGLGRAMLGIAGAVVFFGLAGGPVAAVGLGIAVLVVADALIELDQQREVHEQATQRERRSAPEPTRGWESSSGRGWDSWDSGSGETRGRVCSDDGSGPVCTTSGLSGFVQSPRVWLY